MIAGKRAADPTRGDAPLQHQFSGIGMGQMVMRRALMTPTATALTFEGASSTFEDLAQNILAAARLFTDLGVNEGDRVGYVGLNHPDYLRCCTPVV